MSCQTAFFVVTLVGLVVADSKSSTFLAVTASNGSDVCAVDVMPTAIQWFPSRGSDIQCGLECIRRTHCKAFNFNSELGKCDQYETTPTDFSVIPGCKGYIFEGRSSTVH